jgi:hypothetical protein
MPLIMSSSMYDDCTLYSKGVQKDIRMIRMQLGFDFTMDLFLLQLPNQKRF